MKKALLARPNLDHLRRQAKTLLAALESGDSEAASVLQSHLPAAINLSLAQIRERHHRLADAQSALARKTGFAGWPHLALHVEQLRSLEGAWSFVRLEVDGADMPSGVLQQSRILIDGDRFRTESPEANYEGVFNINVETNPHEIDIEFMEGPEAGNSNFGIYSLEGDKLELCLELNGKPRPQKFSTSLGSGCAYEILQRTSDARPKNVTGGAAVSSAPAASVVDTAWFEYVESPLLARLQGQWTPVKVVSAGMELPQMMLKTGLRVATKNEIKVSFAGRTMVHALVRLNENTNPIAVDYLNLEGPIKGTLQFGILKWENNEACFCMAPPGAPRPADFISRSENGYAFSQWRLKE
jgi:uncharacterized protein (TIGR03067 family)